jgi:phytoene synthase
MSPLSADPRARRRREADRAACRAMIAEGSKSFSAASLLLPAAVRADACALYAFCRVADDAVDLDRRADAVARLRERLDRAYAGRPEDSPVDRAFAELVERHALPRALPEGLIEGLEWDAAGRRYDDLSALRAYAARVAGTVGAMMTVLMDRRDPATLARACDLGVAMQLTNIARDVGEDARNGRIYLPLGWLAAAGLDVEAWLADPRPHPAVAAAVARLLAEADTLYRRAAPGIARLPARCRPAIQAARLLYAAIGAEVARRGHDSVTGRAVVPTPRKLALLGGALATSAARPAASRLPALAETRFLVDAVVEGPALQSVTRAGRRSFDEEVAWVVDLFARLEQRDRTARARGGA